MVFLTLKKATFSIFSKRENKDIIIHREAIVKQKAIAILLYDTDKNAFLFTNQFRYPTIENHNGYILEIAAGGIEGDDSAEETVIREVLEETGYQIKDFEFITTIYVSPGYSTEQTMIYYGEVNKALKVEQGGGLVEETEEIELVLVPKHRLNDLLNGEIIDGKSLISLQWYALNKSK